MSYYDILMGNYHTMDEVEYLRSLPREEIVELPRWKQWYIKYPKTFSWLVSILSLIIILAPFIYAMVIALKNGV